MRLVRLIDGIPLALGAWIAALVCVAWVGRFPYPYDLEWMEGGMLAHAWRISHGLPLYVEPGADWIPYIYPPGQPAVVAALGSVFGLSPPVGRAVSIGGTLLACAALVAGGWRQGSAVAGVLGASVFLSCYPDTGAFYDLVRPDALGMGLAAWSLVLGLEADRRARVASGLLLAASFAVKHNLAVFGVPMALGIWASHGWREALRFGLAAALPALALTLGLEVASADALPVGPLGLLAGVPLVVAGVWARWGREHALWAGGSAALVLGTVAVRLLEDVGHFQRTILGIPGAHPLVAGRMVPGSVEEAGQHLGPLLGACAVALVAGTAHLAGARWMWVVGASSVGALAACAAGLSLETVQGIGRPSWLAESVAWASVGAWVGAVGAGLVTQVRGTGLDGRWAYGVGVVGTAALGAGLMRAHHGGFLNVFIPLHWVVCLATVSALAASRRVWPHPAVWAAGALVVAGQLALKLDLDPDRYVPDDQDRAAGDAFVAALRGCDGPILSPFASWLPVYAGQAPSLHLIALWDVNHRDSPYRHAVGDVTAAAEAHAWACVVDGSGKPLGYGIQKAYEVDVVPPVPRRAITGRPQTFMPRTGWRVRPMRVLVPKETP